MSFNQKIRKLDMFKKVPTDLADTTNIGGAMSLLTIVGILFFAFAEIYFFINRAEASFITNDV